MDSRSPHIEFVLGDLPEIRRYLRLRRCKISLFTSTVLSNLFSSSLSESIGHPISFGRDIGRTAGTLGDRICSVNLVVLSNEDPLSQDSPPFCEIRILGPASVVLYDRVGGAV